MSNEELAKEIQAGATGRMADLWERVEGLCRWKAKQVIAALQRRGNPCGVEFDDLYQTGYLAMVAAVESYRPESGAFSTWFIFHLKTTFAAATGYRTKCGRCEPLNTATSLDRPIQPDESDSGSLAEFISDGNAAAAMDGVEESVYYKQLHEAMEAAIGELPPDNALLSHRYEVFTTIMRSMLRVQIQFISNHTETFLVSSISECGVLAACIGVNIVE